MIWKKKKDASAEADETAEAKSGVSAFAKKNWKWLVPVVVGYWLSLHCPFAVYNTPCRSRL